MPSHPYCKNASMHSLRKWLFQRVCPHPVWREVNGSLVRKKGSIYHHPIFLGLSRDIQIPSTPFHNEPNQIAECEVGGQKKTRLPVQYSFSHPGYVGNGHNNCRAPILSNPNRFTALVSSILATAFALSLLFHFFASFVSIHRSLYLSLYYFLNKFNHIFSSAPFVYYCSFTVTLVVSFCFCSS